MGLAGRGQGDSSLGTGFKKWFGLSADMGGLVLDGERDMGGGKATTRHHCFGKGGGLRKIKCLPSSRGRGIRVPSIKQSLRIQGMY